MNTILLRNLASLSLVATVTTANADLLCYDGFKTSDTPDPNQGEYAVGSVIGQSPNVGTFFSGPWIKAYTAGVDVNVQAASASYGDLRLRAPEGGSLSCPNENRVGRYFATAWNNSTTGTFYMSFLASFGGDGNPGFRTIEGHFGGAAGTFEDANRIFQIGYSQYGNEGENTPPLHLGMNINGAVTNLSPAFTFTGDNAVHLIVLKFAFSDVANSDSVTLWVDPDLSNISVEPPPNAIISDQNFQMDRMTTVTRLGNAPGTDAFFDEIRVATTYAEVVPPAAVSTGTWTNSIGGNWSVAANWISNSIPNSATAKAFFGADSFGLPIVSGDVSLNVPVTLDRITFINIVSPSVPYTISGPQTLTLDNSAQISVGPGDTVHTISATVTSGGSATAITKSGDGTVLLTGANTYAVPTMISGGTLAVNSMPNGGVPGPLGQSISDPSTLILAGGALKYTGPGETSDRVFALSSLGGTLDASGTGPLNLNSPSFVAFTDTTASHVLTLAGTNTGANTLAALISDVVVGFPTDLIKNGSGRWVLGSPNSYSGRTIVNDGVLALGAGAGTTLASTNMMIQTDGTFDVSAVGGFTLGSGQVVQGYGTVVGPLNLSFGSILLPGATNEFGTLTVSNQLIPGFGGEIAMDLSPTNGGPGDFIAGGTLDFNSGGNLSLTPVPWGLWQTGVRTIMSYNTVSGNPANLTILDKFGSRFTFVPSASAGQINLTIGGGAGHNLTWTGGAGTSNWDATLPDLNWNDPALPGPSKFFNPDNVTFDGTGIANSVVTLNGVLFPTSVTANNPSGTYLFQGTGKISGTSTLTKSGTGTLTLANTGGNDYTGDTTVNGGTLRLGVNNVIPSGAGRGNVSIGASGTLDIGDTVANINGLSGSGTATGSFLSTLIVGNNNASSTFGGVISGNMVLVKTNSGTLTLSGLNTYSNSTRIVGGVLVANTIGDAGGSSIGLSQDPQFGVQMQNSTLRYTGATDASTARGITNIYSSGTNFIEVPTNVTLTVSGAMSQDGLGSVANAFHKVGPGTLKLAGSVDNANNSIVLQQGKLILAKETNTVSAVGGFLTIRNGTVVQLYGPTNASGDQIADTALVQIDTGGTLDLNGRSETLGGSVANGSSVNGLAGSGTVLNSSNGTLSTLTISNVKPGVSAFTGKIQDGGGKIALTVSLENTFAVTGSNSYSGDTTVENGTYTLGGASSLPGGPGYGNLIVVSPGILNVAGRDITANSLTGSGTIDNASGNRTNTITAISPAGTTNNFSGVLENTGTSNTRLNLLKTGTGTMQLSGVNIHTGTTVVSNGVLAITGGGSIGSSILIDVTSGTTLDASTATNPISTFSGTLILNSGQTLQGNGTIEGGILAGGGSILSPGESIGTLTADGPVTVAGTTIMELNNSGGQKNDQLVATAIQPFLLGPGNGSTLIVTNIGPALAEGDSFQLFVPKLLNQFKTTVLPPSLPAGLTWKNTLTTDGRITVTSAGGGAPTLTLIWGTEYIGSYKLQVQTNSLAVGLSSNWQDVPGSDLTNQMSFSIDTTPGIVLYRLISVAP